MTVVDPPKIVEPSIFANAFVRRLLGFGVWVAIGLAPLLGKVRVPGFTAVIEMYPETMQRWLIPLSGLLMGMIGVIIEFASERDLSKATLTRWFTRAGAAFLGSLIVLIALYLFTVATVDQSVRLPNDQLDRMTHAFVTGRTAVSNPAPPRCGCEAGLDAEQCISEVSLESTKIKACFGGLAPKFATFSLALVYLALTGAFAAAVGLLMLEQRRRRRARQ
jgi:hypothetical protein